MAWQIDKRTGKVFIDHNMNRSGANISAVYSLRPEAGATVSTPLLWEEVDAGVTPQDFRIDNVWERFEKLGDLFEGVRTSPQELGTGARGGRPVSREGRETPRVDPPHVGGGDRGLQGPGPRRVPAQADLRARGHHRAGAERDRRRGQLVRDPQAPSDAPALRRAARARRRAPVLGRPARPPDPTRRQAPGGADRGPPARVRVVRGVDPRGPLRCGRGQDLRRRVVRARRVDGLEGELPSPRPPVPGSRVPFRQDQDGLARLPRLQPAGAADRLPAGVPADARRGRLEGVRRPGVVVRAEVRRDPLDDHDGDRRHTPGHEERTGRLRQVPGAPDDPRAGGPGERGAWTPRSWRSTRTGRTRSRYSNSG